MKIFNESISPENFPSNGKTVKVTPVFNQKSAITNFRLTFLRRYFSKILEKIE